MPEQPSLMDSVKFLTMCCEIWRYIYDDLRSHFDNNVACVNSSNQIYDSILSRHSTLPIVILAHSYGGLVPFSAPLEKGLVLW